MKTNFYRSYGMPVGHCAEYIFFGKASKVTVLYGVAALVCSLFLSVAPTRAQSVIPTDIPPHVVSIGNNLLVHGSNLFDNCFSVPVELRCNADRVGGILVGK
jgi:hypothetical protein